MGCNYYARIIPSESDKRILKKMIDDNNFDTIKDKVERMYGRFHPGDKYDDPIGEIHLGKSSAGWKFLWNPNIYIIRSGEIEHIDKGNGVTSVNYILNPNTAYYVYPLTKEGIKAFIDRDDVKIYDEYGKTYDKEEFFTWAAGKTDGWDAESYDKKHPNEYKWYNDGEYIDLLEAEGFEFTTDARSEFYSDGLRFATSTDFS